jgi:hypothetical protein
MFKSYLKISWRNLKKDRGFGLFNLVGLSAGLACALFMIYLWVQDERKMGKFDQQDRRRFGVKKNLPISFYCSLQKAPLLYKEISYTLGRSYLFRVTS